MDKNVAFLLRAASEKPEYRAISDYLLARRGMPGIEEANLGYTTSGMYERNTFLGGELPRNGKVTLNKYNTPSDSVGTLIHELTHAAQNQMSIQNADRKDRAGSQFTDAYKKLMSGQAGKLAALLNPEFAARTSDYRSTSNELQAFGMGNSSIEGRPRSPAPLHTDPTMATEFQILLDLAMRDQATKPPKGR